MRSVMLVGVDAMHVIVGTSSTQPGPFAPACAGEPISASAPTASALHMACRNP
jgi:hypothetical protein